MKCMIKNITASIIASALIMVLMSQAVLAATFSVSANKNTVSPDESFTVTISVNGAGKFQVKGDNATVSNNKAWCEGSCQITATAGKAGTATVTVIAEDVTGNDESSITGSKSVSVNVKAKQPVVPSNPSQNNSGSSSTPAPVVKKDSDNKLKTLKISQGTLSPEFNPDTVEYNVELKSNDTKFDIEAVPNSNKAKLSGETKFELAYGENVIKLKVTAENGNPKIYTIKVNLVEEPVTYIDLNGEKLGVLKIPAEIKTNESYEEIKVKINEVEVEAVKDKMRDLTLIHMENPVGDKGLYIYKDGKVEVLKQVELCGQMLILLDAPEELREMTGFSYGTIEIDGIKINGWSFENEAFNKYRLFYALDADGKKHIYQYETTTNSAQLYSDAAPITQAEYEESVDKMLSATPILLGLVGSTAILLIIVIVQFIKIHSLKKRILNKNNEIEDAE